MEKQKVLTKKEVWKKSFRLEEASLIDFVSHLRPYIYQTVIRPTEEHSVSIKKLQ